MAIMAKVVVLILSNICIFNREEDLFNNFFSGKTLMVKGKVEKSLKIIARI